MSAQAAKKPLLKKETLRQLDTAQMSQLDGAVGGTTPAVTVTVPLTILTKEIIEEML
nr:McyA4 [Myxococcus sp.]